MGHELEALVDCVKPCYQVVVIYAIQGIFFLKMSVSSLNNRCTPVMLNPSFNKKF